MVNKAILHVMYIQGSNLAREEVGISNSSTTCMSWMCFYGNVLLKILYMSVRDYILHLTHTATFILGECSASGEMTVC